MSTRRKVRIDRIIILLLLIALIVLGLGFGVYKVFDYFLSNNSNNNKPTPIVDPKPINTTEGVKVTLNNYDVYIDDTDSLGFNFIIAELNFEADGPISYDLGNLQTSEKIYLNNVSKYINTLEEKSYRVSNFGIVNTVVSNDKNYTCKIFIPYTTDSSSLRLLNSSDQSMIEFNLSKNNNLVTSLVLDSDKEIVIGDTNIRVSKSYISTMMIHNDEEFDASGLNYYTFDIYVEKIEENIKITDAIFIRNSDGAQEHCLNNEYRSVKTNNCLNTVLTSGENGALFFEFSGRDGSGNDDGTLMILLSNSSEWVKIPTTLE